MHLKRLSEDFDEDPYDDDHKDMLLINIVGTSHCFFWQMIPGGVILAKLGESMSRMPLLADAGAERIPGPDGSMVDNPDFLAGAPGFYPPPVAKILSLLTGCIPKYMHFLLQNHAGADLSGSRVGYR